MSSILLQDDQSSYHQIKQIIAGQVVGAAQVAIPHGMAVAPRLVIIEPTSAGQIWQSQAADATNVYLTADAAARTCNVDVIA